LEQFLSYRSWMMDQQHPSRFRKLSLNHCGITGAQAARLFHAMGENRGIHLCLSNNPIEDGIEDLVAAIHQQKGPAGLYMEMIELKEESNYLSLIKALTQSRHLTLLSLAGTAPSPSSHGPCSEELVTTLHDFFAHNASIKCLDLSGFCGKLDDGQLAKGFGRSLSGLADNKTMTHLRIRNQNLHDDAGTLGRVLAVNATLLAVDCRDNNLNLTSLRFLVDSLKTHNTTLIEFPFPATERAAIWKTMLRGLQRTPSSTALPAHGTVSSSSHLSSTPTSTAPRNRDLLKGEESLLRSVLNDQFAALDARLRQNRAAALETAAAASEQQAHLLFLLDDAPSPSPDQQHPQTQPPRPAHHHRSASSASSSSGFGIELGADEEEEDRWPEFALALSGSTNTNSNNTAPTTASLGLEPDMNGPPSRPCGARPTVRSSTIARTEADAPSLPAPYGYQPQPLPSYHHMRGMSGGGGSGSGSGGGGMESPTETLDPVSEVETPCAEVDEGPGQFQVQVVDVDVGRLTLPEGVEGDEDEVVLLNMIRDFQAAGFEF
jgi:hypothetical protein